MLLELRNSGKQYTESAKQPLFTNVSLTIVEGEVIVIVGAAKSGKSSLLHILGLLDEPTTGELWLNGENCLNLSRAELAQWRAEKCGYVFQTPFLGANESLLLSVCSPFKIKEPYFKQFTSQQLRAGEIALALVGLTADSTMKCHEMSLFDQQKVCLARALVHSPDLLFVDEPLDGLNRKQRLDLQQLTLDLCQQLNITLVMVSNEAEIVKQGTKRYHLN